jgi:mannose-6-phosphate isomerase
VALQLFFIRKSGGNPIMQFRRTYVLALLVFALSHFTALAGHDKAIFESVAEELKAKDFKVVGADTDRPWGGFFYIDENQIKKFVDIYFPDAPFEISTTDKLSPKILVIAPGKRLSWQYHHRRGELWRVVKGPVGVVRSFDNTEMPIMTHESGAFVKIDKSERHRLVGLKDWSIVAEIWQHTDPTLPSDESDIVRVQDDFSRK